MIEEELRKYVGGKYSSRELRIAINFYKRGLTDKKPTADEMLRALRMEYEKGRADVIGKACEFLKDIFEEYENLTDYNPTEDFKNYMNRHES